MSKPLDLDLLREKLGGREFVYLDSTDSTFIQMKGLARAGAKNGTIVLAEQQTAGRGRLGRSWVSFPYSGLYFSYLIRRALPASSAARFTPALAVAVCLALRGAGIQNAWIKWPNDIVADGKKLCGILCEMELEPCGDLSFVQAGIGLNVYPSPLPDELKDRVGFAARHTAVSREELLCLLLAHVDALTELAVSDFSSVLSQYRRLCCTLGREVLVQGSQTLRGRAEGINSECELLVRDVCGTLHTLRTADVSVRGIMGYV